MALAMLGFLFQQATESLNPETLFLVCIVAAILLLAGYYLGRMQNQSGLLGIDRQAYLAILSEREHEVALLILHNFTNKEICDKLCIEQSTLKTHINKIYQKCKISSRKEFKAKLA